MSLEYMIVSIGALSYNPLWGESSPIRTPHSTTTFIQAGGRMILVDPSLPAAALGARFNERTGKHHEDVTDVFLTTLHPVHRRGLEAFEKARVWAHQYELEAYSGHLHALKDSSTRLGSEDVKAIDADLRLLDRIKPAPEKFDDQVSLYPLAGPSAGSAGLLLTPPTQTIVVAGDAAMTAGHVERGMVWERCADTEVAMESLREIIELADIVIPGHDNIMLIRRQW